MRARAIVLAALLVMAPLGATAQTIPGTTWQTVAASSVGMDAAKLQSAIDFAQAKGQGHLLVSRQGKRVSVSNAGNIQQAVDIKSSTKSYGSVLLCLALQDGRVALSARAATYMSGFGTPPTENLQRAQLVTIQQLATHTAGFAKPGGFIAILYDPGTTFAYSDGGANWLADVLTIRFQKDLAVLFRDRIGVKIGSVITWRANLYRPTTLSNVARREFGSGIGASADDLARLGLLLLRNGRWGAQQILNTNCDDRLRQTPVAGTPVATTSTPNGSAHYGLLWWNNADGWMSGTPLDAFWSWGLGESFVLVVPSKDLVVARVGVAWQSAWSAKDTILEGFFQRIISAVN
jgi:CubicO group peptidase (beta-lactamase class C family)